MALGNSNNNMIFVSTFNGHFVVRVKEGTPGSESRKNKNDREVYELKYSYVEGYLTSAAYLMRVHDAKEYESLSLILAEGEEEYKVDFPWTSRLAQSFFNVMESLDFTKKVRIDITTKDENNVIFIKQNNQVAKWKYTKDNPNGKPNWEQVTVNGKTQWDRTKELGFFREILETKIVPNLYRQSTLPAADSIVAGEPELVESAAGDFPSAEGVAPPVAKADDDLPF
jgi:hypothetical protein